MIIRVSNHADRIRLIAIETMKGAFGNEGALRCFDYENYGVRTHYAVLARTSSIRTGQPRHDVGAGSHIRPVKEGAEATTKHSTEAPPTFERKFFACVSL